MCVNKYMCVYVCAYIKQLRNKKAKSLSSLRVSPKYFSGFSRKLDVFSPQRQISDVSPPNINKVIFASWAVNLSSWKAAVLLSDDKIKSYFPCSLFFCFFCLIFLLLFRHVISWTSAGWSSRPGQEETEPAASTANLAKSGAARTGETGVTEATSS